MPAVKKKETQAEKICVSPKRSKVVQAKMRFEIDIPSDVPKENGEMYALERFKKLCEKLDAIRGVRVEFTMI